MKLKEFNSENCIAVMAKTRVPCVRINMNVGTFRFNKEAVSLAGINVGDQVTLHQDEDEPGDWYIEKVKAKGFTLRAIKDSDTGLLFNNKTLAHEIAASVEFKGKSGKCLIAGTPTKFEKRQLWGLLTSGLRNI